MEHHAIRPENSNIVLPRSIRWRIQLGLLSVPQTEQDWTTIQTLEEVNRNEVQSQREKYEKLKEQYKEELEVACIRRRKRLSLDSGSVEKKTAAEGGKIYLFPNLPKGSENDLKLPSELLNEYLDDRGPISQNVMKPSENDDEKLSDSSDNNGDGNNKIATIIASEKNTGSSEILINYNALDNHNITSKSHKGSCEKSLNNLFDTNHDKNDDDVNEISTIITSETSSGKSSNNDLDKFDVDDDDKHIGGADDLIAFIDAIETETDFQINYYERELLAQSERINDRSNIEKQTYNDDGDYIDDDDDDDDGIDKEFEKPSELSNEWIDVSNQLPAGLTPVVDELQSLIPVADELQQIKYNLMISNIDLVKLSINCGSTIRSDLDVQCDVILKDLERLPSDQHDIYIKNATKLQKRKRPPLSDEEAIKHRCNQLMEILYIYNHEHGEYLQGYHELASLFLLVLEMDVFDESSSHSSSLLLDNKYILHDAYSIIEKVLPQLDDLYSGNDIDVESKLRFVSGDDKFRRHFMAMDANSGLYCARWTRVLFSREIEDWENWLPLMDLFMDLTSHDPSVLSLGDASMYSRPGITPILIPGRMDWMTVLEATAASLIWMHKDELMAVDPSDELCLLLSFKPLQSVNGLIATLLSSLRRIQHKEIPQPTNANFESRVYDIQHGLRHPFQTLKRRLSVSSQKSFLSNEEFGHHSCPIMF